MILSRQNLVIVETRQNLPAADISRDLHPLTGSGRGYAERSMPPECPGSRGCPGTPGARRTLVPPCPGHPAYGSLPTAYCPLPTAHRPLLHFPRRRPDHPPAHPGLEVGVGHRLDVVAQGVVVDSALAVGVDPDDRLVLAGAFLLARVGIRRGEDLIAGDHHRVLIQLVDLVLELRGQALGDGVLDVRLLHAVDVLRPVEALRPPAAGDGLLELLPVRLGEGTRGVVEDHQALAVL